MKMFEFDYENMPNLDDDSPENMEKVDALMESIGKYIEEEQTFRPPVSRWWFLKFEPGVFQALSISCHVSCCISCCTFDAKRLPFAQEQKNEKPSKIKEILKILGFCF